MVAGRIRRLVAGRRRALVQLLSVRAELGDCAFVLGVELDDVAADPAMMRWTRLPGGPRRDRSRSSRFAGARATSSLTVAELLYKPRNVAAHERDYFLVEDLDRIEDHPRADMRVVVNQLVSRPVHVDQALDA